MIPLLAARQGKNDKCAKCNKPRFAHKGKLGVVNPMGGPPLCVKFIEQE